MEPTGARTRGRATAPYSMRPRLISSALGRKQVASMPNGGSDCCGTCWFNAKNKGAAGFSHASDREPDFCTIRSLPIADPFYTYCANHPHRRPAKDPIPIGPVVTGEERHLWQPSPDTEEIRRHLLALLGRIEEQPRSEYPMGTCLDEVVVWQLGEFKESRATGALRRLASFDPTSAEAGPFGRTRHSLVQVARVALGKIAHGSA